jgi:tetratricopeptide (TPR) repeat protein
MNSESNSFSLCVQNMISGSCHHKRDRPGRLVQLAVFLFVLLVQNSAFAQTKSPKEDDNTIATRAYSEGDYYLAITHLKVWLNKNEQIRSNPLVAKVMNPVGKTAFNVVSGQMSPAILLMPDSPVYMRGCILKQLGDACFLKGDYLGAKSYYKDSICANQAREEWISRNNTFFKPKSSPNLDDCLKACESTIQLVEDKHQSKPECAFEKCWYGHSDARDSIAALHYLAIIYDLQGKFGQAEQLYHYTFPYLYGCFRASRPEDVPSGWREPWVL